MPQSRSYAAGHFVFQLDDGTPDPGIIRSVSGGAIKGQIVDEAPGSDLHRVKHIGVVELEPIELELGMALSEPFVKWINDSWMKKYGRHNGCIIHADFDNSERLTQTFYEALIAETKFPALDGSAKESVYLGVTIHPEKCSIKEGDGGKISGVDKPEQKKWLSSNFRLSIGGLNCRHVSKIDGWSVKQKIKQVYNGEDRFPEIEPVGIEFPNLTFYMALEFASDFLKWHEAYVLKGGRDMDHEKQGSIEFLSPNLEETLFTVELANVGIHGIAIEKSQAGQEEVKRCKIDVYVESMSIKYGG